MRVTTIPVLRGPALRTAWSPSLGVVTALMVARYLSAPLLRRTLERWVAMEVDAGQRA